MKSDIRRYESDDITVQYDVKRCIHAAECIRGLPTVFDPDRRPWIDPTNATAEEIAAVVQRCPTGALHFVRRDGGASEPVPEENSMTIAADGPLYVRGNIQLIMPDGAVVHADTRVALCRCGASQNKPFCDGSHTEAGFHDPGTFAE